MPTICVRATVESAETLARRLLSRVDAAWSVTNFQDQVVTLAQGTTVALGFATTYILQADPLAPVQLTWSSGSAVVTVPLNGLSVVAPGAALTLVNSGAVGTNAVPVRVVSFT